MINYLYRQNGIFDLTDHGLLQSLVFNLSVFRGYKVEGILIYFKKQQRLLMCKRSYFLSFFNIV